MIYFTVLKQDDVTVLTVLHNGQPLVATSTSHPQFDELVRKVLADDETVFDMFTVEQSVAKKFERLSERVSIHGGEVFLDGDPVDNSLTRQILRFIEEDVADWEPLVNFFEKVQQNPSEHSREQLYRWLAKHEFTISYEGDIVGYKGVRDDLTSVHTGPAIVDGVAMDGHIPNKPGTVIEMARTAVQFDPGIGCAQGLHVANWRYASSWSQKTLEVHVNPRDVVSVPTDSNDEKVRVCRYFVVGVVTVPFEGAVLAATVTESDDENDYHDDCCDEGYCYADDCLADNGDEYCSTCHLSDGCGWCADTAPVNDASNKELNDIEPGWLWQTKEGQNFLKVVNDSFPEKTDTRQNHIRQQRDSNGRFLPKS